MAKFRFDRAAVLRCVKHALAAPDHRKGFGETVASAGLFLVKDDGVYLMSNGAPGDVVEGTKHFVAYAKGYDPTKGDVWQKAQSAAGGDDFSETIPLDEQLAADLLAGGDIVISLTASSMRVGVLLARDENKTRDWLQKLMAGNIVFFPARARKVKAYDLAKISERHARAHCGLLKATILNDMPLDEAVDLYIKRTA